jgi:hypothetical protein
MSLAAVMLRAVLIERADVIELLAETDLEAGPIELTRSSLMSLPVAPLILALCASVSLILTSFAMTASFTLSVARRCRLAVVQGNPQASLVNL